MKQLYVTDPSKHKFLVKAVNSPNAFSNMICSVLSLFPGFYRRKNQLNNSKMLKNKNKLHKLHLRLQLLKPSILYIVVKVQK